MTDARDIGPDNGKKPPYERDAGGLGAVGSDAGSYSGQEYDAAGQAAWRARQKQRAVPEDGTVVGSGVGAGGGDAGEDFDTDTTGGSRPD